MVEKDLSFLWEVTLWEFFLVTLLIGGAAAWLTGRAIARVWQPNWLLAIYLAMLAAAIRFIHYALFDGTLLSIWYYCVDLFFLLLIGFAGKRFTRARQMASQYGFSFARAGPFGWSRRD